MIVYKCDRCGKFYEFYGGPCNEVVPNGIQTIEWKQNFPTDFFTKQAYNLCPDCMNKIMAFLENKEDLE